MAKKDSVNVSIFTALKIGEKAKNVPVLLMSNPGMGKSTTVAMFAKHRGYHLQYLKGNSTSETEIIGYDVVPTKDMSVEVEDIKSTIHLRPSWYAEILKKEKEGIPTLLFLDELTTAPEHVQAALLQLIFDRKVGDEDLPESTLVVAAGNYVQNLSNQMNLIPPLMNRFMIYNIVADDSDLDAFLCKYKGAIASPEGKISNSMDNLKNILVEMDKKEKPLTEGVKNKIGEYIERQILETARALMKSGDRALSFKVTDLQSIYGDTIDDGILYGFATLRTLGHLRDVTLASYQCFGKDGLNSDAYENMIAGLCGIGVSRDPKSKEVKKTLIVEEFKNSMKIVANDIDRMNNGSIPLYEAFLSEVISKMGKKGFETPEITVLEKKFEEILQDKSLDKVETPIDPSLMVKIFEGGTKSVNNLGIQDISITSGENIAKWLETVDIDKLAGIINKWNSIGKFYEVTQKFLATPNINYKREVSSAFTTFEKACKGVMFKLNIFRKMIDKNSTGYEKIIPEILKINVK